MAIGIFHLQEDNKIGVVYTPLEWAEWAVSESGIQKAWLKGKTVLDPTVGDGKFIEALIAITLKSDHDISDEIINNLYGFDIRKEGIEELLARIKKKYGITLNHKNFKVRDITLVPNKVKFDLIVGNPPWVTFNKLPLEYKEKLKMKFQEFGLIKNSGSVLLGNSRVDISALIINILIDSYLEASGTLALFLPASLFFGGSAHSEFRKFVSKGKEYHLISLHDFSSLPIFSSGNKHGTPYCFAKFSKTQSKETSNIQYFLLKENKWIQSNHKSIENLGGSVKGNSEILESDKLKIKDIPKPRQGINTGGRNSLLFGTLLEGNLKDETVLFQNGEDVRFEIESKHVYPLLMRENFKSNLETPLKYALICHNSLTGKVLDNAELSETPLTVKYLNIYKNRLSNRKGILINVNISKGFYWGLMGVGKYNFTNFKVVWLSAGEQTLDPRIFGSFQGKSWQANQSLQSFIPVNSRLEANIALEGLLNLKNSYHPSSFGTPGTLGWGQPGQLKKFMTE